MRIVNNSRSVRTVYAFEAEGEFMLSPLPETCGGRRPIGRYGTKEELETHAASRNCEVQWLQD